MSKKEDDEFDLDLSLDELELDEVSASETPVVEVTAKDAASASELPAGTAEAVTAVTVAEPATAASPTAPATAPATVATEVEGQWVWQYGAPPPPPSFGARFFSGRALGELYRFFACGLLVFIGSLLPWGKSMAWVVEHGESTLAYEPPAGYELTLGAISMALALWLIGASCYGIYTGRQKIMPVFLMLIPAWISWGRMLEAWDLVADMAMMDALVKVAEVAGTGVFLTMVGSTIVALQLLLVVLKVLRKKPDAEGGSSGRTRKSKEPAAKKDKKDKNDRKKDKGKDDADGKGAASEASGKNGDGKGRSGSRLRGRKR